MSCSLGHSPKSILKGQEKNPQNTALSLWNHRLKSATVHPCTISSFLNLFRGATHFMELLCAAKRWGEKGRQRACLARGLKCQRRGPHPALNRFSFPLLFFYSRWRTSSYTLSWIGKHKFSPLKCFTAERSGEGGHSHTNATAFQRNLKTGKQRLVCISKSWWNTAGVTKSPQIWWKYPFLILFPFFWSFFFSISIPPPCYALIRSKKNHIYFHRRRANTSNLKP